ncbi:hypothetical protein [Christiangramia forsetii]|uniref:Uncharacterized protein n=2 Tax=Christiangramia forsetii TaxID=411153 RepID=A0M445_CHRFK|nr:hypothetical protein [Christiangramia forsetii]GGG24278.1 hypothetical protein GCM10011532_04380 [Christiangramia forsetii]CAL67390.1 hypothetical protein GFO_2434 [Christiangramia forsetii KT0803]
MINRFPHTATIKLETVGEGKLPEVTKEEITLKGRYEPEKGNKNLDYKAKFYCEQTPEQLKSNPHAFDDQKMDIFGRSITIKQAWPYQTHCELWLD